MTPKVVQLHEYSLNFKDFFEIDRIFCSLGLSLRTWKLGHREIFSPHTIILSWNLDLPNLIFMSCCHIFLCAYHQHIFVSWSVSIAIVARTCFWSLLSIKLFLVSLLLDFYSSNSNKFPQIVAEIIILRMQRQYVGLNLQEMQFWNVKF